MTEVVTLYTDTYAPWYQSANALQGFLWCEQDGEIVAGSNTEQSTTAPAKTGDTQADINTWVLAALQDIIGAAPLPIGYTYPGALVLANSWGSDAVTGVPGNPYLTRPFVALAYSDDFTFGDANIPANISGLHPRVWKFRIKGRGTASNVYPSTKQLLAFETDNEKLPGLITLEMVSE